MRDRWRRLPVTRSGGVYFTLIAMLGVLPWVTEATGQGFLLDLASRGLIFAIAALSPLAASGRFNSMRAIAPSTSKLMCLKSFIPVKPSAWLSIAA